MVEVVSEATSSLQLLPCVMSSDCESNIAGTSGIFGWTSVVASLLYPQDTIWLPSSKQINSEIIQPFPLQICKLSYTTSSN